jgi:hypothetical protein
VLLHDHGEVTRALSVGQGSVRVSGVRGRLGGLARTA